MYVCMYVLPLTTQKKIMSEFAKNKAQNNQRLLLLKYSIIIMQLQKH